MKFELFSRCQLSITPFMWIKARCRLAVFEILNIGLEVSVDMVPPRNIGRGIGGVVLLALVRAPPYRGRSS